MTAPARQYVPEVACRLALSEARELLDRLDRLNPTLASRHPELAAVLSETAGSVHPGLLAALRGSR